MKLKIITSCTGMKQFKPESQLTKEDFRNPNILPKREIELRDYAVKAGDMYTGLQHLQLMKGVALLRQKYGTEAVDVNILSAGYGLLEEERLIVPYEMTFNDMKAQQLKEWSDFISINKQISQAIVDYDMVFFLLGEKYIRALQLPFSNTQEDQRLVFLCSYSSCRLIPFEQPYYAIPLGQDDAIEFSYGLIGLKGYLFRLFANEVICNDGLMEELYYDPQKFMECLYHNKEEIFLFPDVNKTNKKRIKQESPPKPAIDFYIPREDYAKNAHRELVYYIPECDDRVDPNYNFIDDCSKKSRNAHMDDFYAHQIYQDRPNYNGILVSKCNIEQSKIKKQKIEEIGLRDYIRYPKDKGLLMGDCGAWTYVNHEVPPYETEEILDYYERLQFDIGVSIDHLIAPGLVDQIERNRRYRITLNNAQLFINRYREGNYNFIPSGVAQGWDPKSYRNAVVDLIDMGYKHISLGGLAQEQSKRILDIMKEVRPVIPEDMNVHLFGVGRQDLLMATHKLGITSFDCSRPLRQAWGGASSNYYAPNGRTYSAIRVPQVDYKGGGMYKRIKASRNPEITYQLYKEKEQRSLKCLRFYDQGLIGLDEALEAIMDYDQLVGPGRQKHAKLYREVLEDQPWKQCDCEICRQIGIEVIIFRGNNRNRRRGFHNTYIYYKQFEEQLKNINYL